MHFAKVPDPLPHSERHLSSVLVFLFDYAVRKDYSCFQIGLTLGLPGLTVIGQGDED